MDADQALTDARDLLAKPDMLVSGPRWREICAALVGTIDGLNHRVECLEEET